MVVPWSQANNACTSEESHIKSLNTKNTVTYTYGNQRIHIIITECLWESDHRQIYRKNIILIALNWQISILASQSNTHL